ncbi:MAG: DUF4416 family protein [bacterium]
MIAGIISSDVGLYLKVQSDLVEKFGPIDYESETFPFDYTDYYRKEMGEPLHKKFIAFQRLISPDEIAEIKLFTNRVEEEYSVDGRRRVNIDPGYVEMSKLVLPTTKNYAHRIYLGKGIYAEVTLIFQDGEFRPTEWTYPDYRTELYRRIASEIRELYKHQLREAKSIKASSPECR